MESGLEEITLAELLQLALDDRQADIHVALPARVDAFHADANPPTIDCTPQLNRSLPDGAGNYVSETLPQLADVPVAYQRCKKFMMTYPLDVGDYVLLVFSERSLAAWRANGQQGDPGDLRMHTLDGAVAIPGLYPDGGGPQSAGGANMLIGADGTAAAQIEITPTGINLGAGATDNVLTKADFLNFLFVWNAAAVGTVDGGALMRTNTLSALSSTSLWPTPAASPGLGSSTVKAKR